MTSHTVISPQEAAGRLAIRELVDAYAHCADRRDARGQMDLFTEDTRFLVFYDLTSKEPSQELHGRESLAPAFDDLNQYAATMHFNGQSTISLDGTGPPAKATAWPITSRLPRTGLVARSHGPPHRPAFRRGAAEPDAAPEYALVWRATLSAAGLFAQLGATVPTRGLHLAYSPGFRGSLPSPARANAPGPPPHRLYGARLPAPAWAAGRVR